MVIEDLTKSGHHYVRVDSGECGIGSRLCFDPSFSTRWLVDSEELDCIPQHTDFSFADASVVWLRRFSSPKISHAQLCPHSRFITHEWMDLLLGTLLTLRVPVVNHPRMQFSCPKTLQLRIAKEVGLRVPETRITNDPNVLLALFEQTGGDLVHKAFKPLERVTLLVERVLSEHLDSACLETLSVAPVIFQANIHKTHDVRVIVVGDDIFAARCIAPPAPTIDVRAVTGAPYEKCTLPHGVEAQIHALMARLGLAMGALDFVVGTDQELYFLEANPQGQFLYVEQFTGQRITSAVASFLTKCAALGRYPHRPPDSGVAALEAV